MTQTATPTEDPRRAKPVSRKEPLPVTAIWSRCIGTNIETWVEVDGEWYRCIVESGDNFSWIAESRGFKNWPKMAAEGSAQE